VSFGLFEMDAAVAFFAGDFGLVTVILKSGVDGVKGIRHPDTNDLAAGFGR